MNKNFIKIYYRKKQYDGDTDDSIETKKIIKLDPLCKTLPNDQMITYLCRPTESYFIEFENIGDYLDFGYFHYDYLIYIVDIQTTDTQLISSKINKREYLLDNFIIRDIYPIEKYPSWFDLEICQKTILKNSNVMRYIQIQNEQLSLIAIKNNPWNIKYIKNQTNELCKLAIEEEPSTIVYLKDQTEELCMIALNKCPAVIKYIHHPTNQMYELFNDFDKKI